MSDLDNDPLVRRAIDELRELPAVDAAAVRRVVAVAAAARVAPADEPVPLTSGRRLGPVWSVVGIAAAAAIAGFIARGALTARARDVTPAESAVGSTPGPIVPVRNEASERDAMAIPQQFVFEHRNAHRISVVGDFNRWNSSSNPMTRSPDGTTWSVIVPILPGRHIFGFMVDDSVFTLDPRAPKVRDPDFGTAGSVIMVGRP